MKILQVSAALCRIIGTVNCFYTFIKIFANSLWCLANTSRYVNCEPCYPWFPCLHLTLLSSLYDCTLWFLLLVWLLMRDNVWPSQLEFFVNTLHMYPRVSVKSVSLKRGDNVHQFTGWWTIFCFFATIQPQWVFPGCPTNMSDDWSKYPVENARESILIWWWWLFPSSDNLKISKHCFRRPTSSFEKSPYFFQSL